MKLIDFDQIKNLNIPPLSFYNWVDEIIRNKDKMILPVKTSIKFNKNSMFYNFMPAVIPSINRAGIKIVTRYPNRSPSIESLILIFDFENGNPLALMDGTYITAMRTGAVAAHSVKLFARQDWQVLSIIGLGNTARAALEVISCLYPEKSIDVHILRYKNQHDLFIKCFEGNRNLHFTVCDTVEETISKSDVIISAVTFYPNDICNDSCFPEGCLLLPIHTRGFTNCDLFFDKVFADDKDHIKNFKNFDKFKSFAEVHDVISGKKPGRENTKERILVYNIGIGLHDLYCANKILNQIQTSTEFDLEEPAEKFWVK